MQVSLRAKVFAVMAVPVVVLVASAGLGYVTEQRSNSLLDASQHAAAVQHEIDTVLADLFDAETGTRGYVLTGDKVYLDPYNDGARNINADLTKLTALTAGDAIQAQRIARLRILVTDRLTTLVQTQRLAPMTRPKRDAIVLLMNEGNGLMTTIRSVLGDLDRDESAVLDAHQLALDRARHITFLLVVVGTPGALLLALALVFLFAERVVSRISRIEENARRLERGEPMLEATGAHDEIGELGRVLVETGARLAELQAELRRMATADELTGLSNRRGFMAVAEHQLNLAGRLHEPLALMFLDLDNLKVVNDTLGHGVGDEMLKETAQLLLATFRNSDLVARVGGDEFCVLLTTEQDPGAQIALGRLREVMARRNLIPDRTYALSFSVGMAEFDWRTPIGIDDLIESADSRMYAEKRAKRAAREGADAHV
jgi:diguanylate cyclase (GGDEF)-like protein